MISQLETLVAAARRLICRRVAFACMALCHGFIGFEAIAQPAGEAQFSMGKSTTTFAPSSRFETVTFYKKGSPLGVRVVSPPSTAAPLVVRPDIGRVVMLPSLEKYGVLLVQLAPNVSYDALDPVLDAYNHQSPAGTGHVAVAGKHSDGNPIYASGSVDNLVVNELIIQFERGISSDDIEDFIRSLNLRILRVPADSGQEPYLVEVPGQSGHGARVLSNRVDARIEVSYSQPNFIGIDYRRLVGTGGQTSGPEECALRCPAATSIASGGDPFFEKQWHLNNTGAIGSPFADINAINAWGITQGNPSIVIAVLDDWIEVDHEDLVGKIQNPWNAFAADGSFDGVELQDSDRHGTAAAGLAAAVSGNGLGIAGIAPKVKIMPVRTHNPSFPHDVIAAGIRHAAANADVLSMSWMLGETNKRVPVVKAAIEYASVQMGRVLVFAAGNQQGFDVSFPASLTNLFPIIAVSATNAADSLKKITDATDVCDWGTQTGADTVAAPGVDLYTTDRSGDAGYCAVGDDNNYALFGGTSAATPLVAGTAALMLSANPNLTPLQIRSRLQQSAKHPTPANRPNDNGVTGWGLGWGRIDACKALGAPYACARFIAHPAAPFGLSIQ